MSVVINGSAGVTTNSGAVYNGIQAGTAVASTSGTSIDFTSIPSWVKRITVMFQGVSLNSSSSFLVQLGAGSVTTTGYVSTTAYFTNAGAGSGLSSTAGFISFDGSATQVMFGSLIITNITANSWVCQGNTCNQTGTAFTTFSAGGVTLSGTLDRVRITTVNGTDTFDAGSINILYE